MSTDTAVLVVDMQKDFFNPKGGLHMDGLMDIVPSIEKLLLGARKKGWQVVHIVRGHDASGVDVEKYRVKQFLDSGGFAVEGTDGWREIEQIAPQKGDLLIQKTRFSGFFATKLDLVLRRLGIKRIVICGMQYPNCIRSTAVDGMALDYDVSVCTDATWGASPEVVKANIFDMENMGIACLSLDEILK